MSPDRFQPKNVIVQGITGNHGSFHTRAMVAAGTNVVAGTSPNKAGQNFEGIPVYATIGDIMRDHSVDASVIFVPAPYAKAAILEAVDAGVPLIICITEGIPVFDMLDIQKRLERSSSMLVGPNCPGLLIPGVAKLGIIPSELGLPGNTAIVSRSGTLTYEAMAGLSARGIGQAYVIGIGGDQIHGIGFIEALTLFEADENVQQVVLIGEIGGQEETLAAEFIARHVKKPVYGYIAGHHAPAGVQLGHAGAILGSDAESAAAKTEKLRDAGVSTANSIVELIDSVRMV